MFVGFDGFCGGACALRATLSSLFPQGSVFIAYVGADGKVNPITAKAAAPKVTPPYLQMSFKAKSLDDLKKRRAI